MDKESISKLVCSVDDTILIHLFYSLLAEWQERYYRMRARLAELESLQSNQPGESSQAAAAEPEDQEDQEDDQGEEMHEG